MCDDGHGHSHAHSDVVTMDPTDDPVLNGTSRHPTRRGFLTATAGGLAGVVGSGFLPIGTAYGAAAPTPLTNAQLIRTAMHVHGSWDEGQGSWESQFAQADALGLRVLYMSTHDYRAEAYNYLPSLVGVTFDPGFKSGSLAQFAASNSGGTVRVMAQSSTSSPASYGVPLQAKPLAANRLRTSIAGQVLTLAFAKVQIGSGGTYEVVVTLSNHPAHGSHRVGQYSLRYRFGGTAAPRKFLDASGIVGIVSNPTPSPGQRFTFDLTSDVAALWPDLVAFDNTFFMLAFVATSPAQAVVVDVSVTMQFARSMNDPSILTALHQQLIANYGPRHPGLTAYPTVEVSRFDPLHVIAFGTPQTWPDQSAITKSTVNEAYTKIADAIHAQHGLMSMNHPFGPNDGPAFSPAGMEAARAATYTGLNGVAVDHADILEVGYTLRGSVNTLTHLALLDTFVRNGYFLTGTGVNDDHGGVNWPNLSNGFVTGIWATSAAQADLVIALAGGRVFTYHPQRWATCQLDTMLEDGTRMGQASLSTKLTRTLSIFAPGLPQTASVQVVVGPVDKGGNKPGSSVVATLNGSRFTGVGVVPVPLSISGPCYVRVQAVLTNGQVAGISNPTWMFPKPPTVTIPPARRSATA
jgi:hypothetical protein